MGILFHMKNFRTNFENQSEILSLQKEVFYETANFTEFFKRMFIQASLRYQTMIPNVLLTELQSSHWFCVLLKRCLKHPETPKGRLIAQDGRNPTTSSISSDEELYFIWIFSRLQALE
jgi:hypothetical protein